MIYMMFRARKTCTHFIDSISNGNEFKESAVLSYINKRETTMARGWYLFIFVFIPVRCTSIK